MERNDENNKMNNYITPILGAILFIGGLWLLGLGIILYNIQLSGNFNFHTGSHVIYEIIGISINATIIMGFGINKIFGIKKIMPELYEVRKEKVSQ